MHFRHFLLTMVPVGACLGDHMVKGPLTSAKLSDKGLQIFGNGFQTGNGFIRNFHIV